MQCKITQTDRYLKTKGNKRIEKCEKKKHCKKYKMVPGQQKVLKQKVKRSFIPWGLRVPKA